MPGPLRCASRTPGVGFVLAVVAPLAWGCGGDAVSTPSPTASASTVAAPSASASAPRRFKLTPPATALSNFQGQLRQTEELLERRPDDLDLRQRVAGSYVTRASLLGAPADFTHALALVDAAPASPGQEKALRLMKASTLAAVHRFDAAMRELEAAVPAEELRQPSHAARLRASILAGQGKLDEALAIVAQVRAIHAEIGILTLEGKILGDMGRVDDAVAAFDLAEAKNRNPSPFAVADLHFERALMWETRGELDKAKAAYQATLDALPMHAHAVFHLAQLLLPKEGVALLLALKGTSSDPEVDARLGELRELVEKGSGEADLKAAAKGYEAAAAALPEAYADHAGWFFAGPGKDPERAWTWAKKNLEGRQTYGAFELALTAARLAKIPAAEHCDLAKRAKAYRWHSPRLDEELTAYARTEHGGACGL